MSYGNSKILSSTSYKLAPAGAILNIAATIKVYPNPANQTVTIEYTLDNDCNAKLLLLNTLGQTLRIINLDSKKNKAIFSTEELQQGLYHYQLKCDDAKLSNGKLVIIH